MRTGKTTAASTQAKLYHDVREPAKTVDMVPELKHNSLISGVKFADANYIKVLTPTEVLIYDGNDMHISISKESILRGWRDTTTGLWRVPLQPNIPPLESESIFLDKSRGDAIANFYELPSTKKSIRYLHACAGFPTKAYWLEAINGGNYATWRNITAEAMKKHFPESNETNQGHIRGIKKNIRPTKENRQPLTYQLENIETLTIPLQKHQYIYVKINDLKETMYTNQTGAFPVTSKQGNKYTMILCEIENDVIMSEAIQNRSSGEIVRAYQVLMQRLKSEGIRPKKHLLDNECSTEFKQAIKENKVEY